MFFQHKPNLLNKDWNKYRAASGFGILSFVSASTMASLNRRVQNGVMYRIQKGS